MHSRAIIFNERHCTPYNYQRPLEIYVVFNMNESPRKKIIKSQQHKNDLGQVMCTQVIFTESKELFQYTNAYHTIVLPFNCPTSESHVNHALATQQIVLKQPVRYFGWKSEYKICSVIDNIMVKSHERGFTNVALLDHLCASSYQLEIISVMFSTYNAHVAQQLQVSHGALIMAMQHSDSILYQPIQLCNILYLQPDERFCLRGITNIYYGSQLIISMCTTCTMRISCQLKKS